MMLMAQPILKQFGQRMTKPLPHVERHGVALFGVIEGDDAHAVGDALSVALGAFSIESGFRL